MRILLPPSEGKTRGGRGPALLEAGFGAGPLSAHREHLARTVAHVAGGSREEAVRAFVLPGAVAEAALQANSAVLTSPTRTALSRYAGVVYDGLDLAGLTRAQKQRAAQTILIFSGLFGVVRGDELIPDYRVPAAAVLPGVGGAGSSWRPILSTALPDLLGEELVVDLRSIDYAAMWRPTGELAERLVTVRVLSPRPDGTTAVISHFSKHGKGRLAHALLVEASARRPARTASDIARIWRAYEGGPADIKVRAGRTQVDLVTA